MSRGSNHLVKNEGFFTLQIFTRSSHGQAKNRPSENLQCKNPSFFTKWLDPLDLSQEKNSFRSGLYTPLRGAYWYCIIFFYKVSLMKHPSAHGAKEMTKFKATKFQTLLHQNLFCNIMRTNAHTSLRSAQFTMIVTSYHSDSTAFKE